MSYRDSVKRTLSHVGGQQPLTNGALGLCGETGEVADIIKKHVFHGKPLDREHLIEELGDVRWYMELLCMALNTTLEEVEAKNTEKLQKRYPNGFP